MREYFILIKYQLKAQLQYPLDFLIQMIIWGIYTFIPFIALNILMAQFDAIGEWNSYQIALLYGIVGLGYDISRFVGRGFDNFHQYTLSGNLDVLFIRPVGIITQIMGNNLFLRRIAGILNYLIIVIVSSAIIFKQQDYPLFIFIGTIAISTISATLIFLGLLILYASTCIFTINKNIVSDIIIDNVSTIGYIPTNQLHIMMQKLLLYIIPIGTVVYIPIQGLLFNQNVTGYGLMMTQNLVSIVISSVFICIAKKVFLYSLKYYSSTGSS